MLWSKEFWLGAAERAIKTFAGALVSSLVGYTVLGAVPWLPALGTAALATLVSFLIAVGNADFTAGVPAQVQAPVPDVSVTGISTSGVSPAEIVYPAAGTTTSM